MIEIDYEAALRQNPAGVFATKDGERVRTRVFQHLFTEKGRVYFSTSSEKPVYAQMTADPNVSFCVFAADFSINLSVSGKAVFVEETELKKRALDENPQIKNIYKTPENPVFKIFYIEVEEVETFTFSEGPRKYKL
ncbi:MAG: pyridoxamine 5'-phosphate oxidase family protein [Clostridiales bacterium]|jgi:uncharacterized pyridoxamine 5'-phosphate oxidase family protein|nr:pyridoxamine 5'-phosphate oxidase family protein [Clostridiales bacterium]